MRKWRPSSETRLALLGAVTIGFFIAAAARDAVFLLPAVALAIYTLIVLERQAYERGRADERKGWARLYPDLEQPEEDDEP